MTNYIVHLYREMRLSFADIEAETAEAAAALAREKATDEADDIEDCNGEESSALVDLAGDEDYRHSVTIDFEGERIRKAAWKLLAALRLCHEQLSCWVADTETCDLSPEDEEALAKSVDAIAGVDAAGIVSEPSAPTLLTALNAVLPYAENERESLRECWERDDDPKVKEELGTCDRALTQAHVAIAEAKTAGIQSAPAPAKQPSRFEIEHDPLENPDRAYVLVDGRFGVAIIRTSEGIVIDVYPKDWIDPIDSLTVWDEQIAAASAEAEADNVGEA